MRAGVVLEDEVDREAGEGEEAGSEVDGGEVEAGFKLKDSSICRNLPSLARSEEYIQIAGLGKDNLRWSKALWDSG